MSDPTIALAWLGDDVATVRTVATIWATVDLERALRDLGGESDAAEPVAEPLLGARIALVVTTEGRLAVAEPTTEGRLAATLARHGEGPAGSYQTTSLDIVTIADRASAAGIRLSRPAAGPFGRGVLVLGRPVSGPHLILVEAAAVPSRS